MTSIPSWSQSLGLFCSSSCSTPTAHLRRAPAAASTVPYSASPAFSMHPASSPPHHPPVTPSSSSHSALQDPFTMQRAAWHARSLGCVVHRASLERLEITTEGGGASITSPSRTSTFTSPPVDVIQPCLPHPRLPLLCQPRPSLPRQPRLRLLRAANFLPTPSPVTPLSQTPRGINAFDDGGSTAMWIMDPVRASGHQDGCIPRAFDARNACACDGYSLAFAPAT
ncbi:hypothetical protein B0H11DRAFT_2229970 [Mycena galericulata]|nr:hypothetical protein B0H11DRAFT_2229970 [Mycena galericulata]